MKLNELAIIGVAATTVVSCTPAKTEYASYELYPVRSGSLTEMEYTPAATQFTLWAPTADEVRLMLFEAGDGGHAYETISMESSEEGTSHVSEIFHNAMSLHPSQSQVHLLRFQESLSPDSESVLHPEYQSHTLR